MVLTIIVLLRDVGLFEEGRKQVVDERGGGREGEKRGKTKWRRQSDYQFTNRIKLILRKQLNGDVGS